MLDQGLVELARKDRLRRGTGTWVGQDLHADLVRVECQLGEEPGSSRSRAGIVRKGRRQDSHAGPVSPH